MQRRRTLKTNAESSLWHRAQAGGLQWRQILNVHAVWLHDRNSEQTLLATKSEAKHGRFQKTTEHMRGDSLMVARGR
eukprot:scaffold99975_cov34-Prasinocladus_malaysianus.AAC.1